MKRRDLERHLRKHGARLLREGGSHSYWGFDEERSTSVPRHREVDWRVAREICKQPAIPRPPGGKQGSARRGGENRWPDPYMSW